MSRKILISGLSILGALGIVSAATFAYFSDVGASTGNSFVAGTFDLKLSDDTPDTLQDDVTASFGGTNLAPGSCTSSQQLRLRNSGTVAGNHVDITASNTDSAFAAFLKLDTLNYDSSDVRSKIAESNGNGYKDLADWAADTNGLEDLALTNTGGDHNLDMVVCMDVSATISQQGLTDSATFTSTLRQQTHGSEI